MKAVLFMAISLNGVIARENGDEDFLSHDNWETFSGFVREYGNFVVGKRTYEAVRRWKDGHSFNDFPKAKRIVVSDDPLFRLDKGYTFAGSPLDALDQLVGLGFKTALITGGSTLNSSFVKKNLLDEIIINVEPTIIGKGIPLFAPDEFQASLKLLNIKKITDNIIQLHYKVEG
ncbi:MAG: dihydrofolate reductase family protein [Candidatus Wildermuthbacteria bacterium]|nr:dihydrofolate reductase family protein [Candidatus Wildermuthbacteria bacterium]